MYYDDKGDNKTPDITTKKRGKDTAYICTEQKSTTKVNINIISTANRRNNTNMAQA
jgi:hypothetical protein